MLNALLIAATLLAPPVDLPENIWLEAEWFAPLKGSNFSFLPAERAQRGSWAVAGPDAAPAWTQGGESEFMSIAARADEPGEVTVSRDIEIPLAGNYRLWVRYADYRTKKAEFGLRVVQGGKSRSHIFGSHPVIDDMDPMKLLWDWAYAWDSCAMPLAEGAARLELFTNGPTGARRCVDCLCLTTDESYHPFGREKPDFAAWGPLRRMQSAGMPEVKPLAARKEAGSAAWSICTGPPSFLWNVGEQWFNELKKPQSQRVDEPFGVDPPMLPDFLKMFGGHEPPVYASRLSGPVIHISLYPQSFRDGSPVLDWLKRHPDRRFAILLNYGDPTWQKDDDRKKVAANLAQFGDRFIGFIAGENFAYDDVPEASLKAQLGAAKSREDALQALKELHGAAVAQKFSGYYGRQVSPVEAWAPVISCLSATNEAFAHVICSWGAKQIGHENTGNSPTLARRLAILRGACRQFGARLVDYQSCNLGDAATMYSRESFFYGASSRYVMDNSYDVFAGAGVNWLLKDYILWHLAGVTAFYNEQGLDMFWKPGGNVAGDTFPVQLSPKGKTAEAVIGIAEKHPRGTQYTPVAFLLDQAHGCTQERFQPGAFGLDPATNPAVLSVGKHEAAIRGWFDAAYYPAPVTQSEPSSAIRQTYVNGIFGDIFDVIVTAPGRTSILNSYPVVIVGGEIMLTREWGAALAEYVRKGGTLVIAGEQLSGPGATLVDPVAPGPVREASAFTWGGAEIASNRFRYRAMSAGGDEVLAAAPRGGPICTAHRLGQGKLIRMAAPLGLGIDQRPTPLTGLLLQRLVSGLMPVRAVGDVEWVVNRIDGGRWLIALLNNRGVIKPEHGVLPTDQREAVTVKLQAAAKVRSSSEWMTGAPVEWHGGSTTQLTVPPGAVRLIEIDE